MRKSFTILLVMVLCASVFSGIVSAAPARTEINVIMDGKRLPFPDARPFIDGNNRTLVPVRFVAENLGAKVAWHDDVDRVDISLDGKYISLTIGDKNALVNGEEVAFDTAAVIRDNRTFVPLRFVSDALGEQVEWDGLSNYVWLGEKKILTPEQKGLTKLPIEDFYKYFPQKETRYLKDQYDNPIKEAIVIEESDFPLQLGSFTVYDIWDNQDNYIGFRSSNSMNILYLTDDNFYPRLRSDLDPIAERHPDKTSYYYYKKFASSDDTFLGDTNYRNFKIGSVDYIAFFIGEPVLYLLKNPFVSKK